MSMSKARRWRLLLRVIRYDHKMYEVTGGHKPILMKYRTRAVDRMFAAYPNWPWNSKGGLQRGFRL